MMMQTFVLIVTVSAVLTGVVVAAHEALPLRCVLPARRPIASVFTLTTVTTVTTRVAGGVGLAAADPNPILASHD